MATVYSLVCFGGLSGKTVTFTDTGDVVNLATHGLRPGVTGVVFYTTGSLPTGVTAGTTYYPRDGADGGKFTIYLTKADALAGTNQVTFTGTGSGTHTVKSSYMLGMADKSRYGDAGVERIYAGIGEWRNARSAVLTATPAPYDEEVCEIGEAFVETITALVRMDLYCAASSITSMVNGDRSSAFPAGKFNEGFIINHTGSYTACIMVSSPYCTLDGFQISMINSTNNILVSYDTATAYRGIHGLTLCNCLLTGKQNNTSTGFYVRGSGAILYNNIIINVAVGISLPGYTGGLCRIYNNLITKCGTGLGSTYEGNQNYYYNNLSIGNLVNWTVTPLYIYDGAGNVGSLEDRRTLSLDYATDIFTLTSHGLKANQKIRLETSGSLPAPLVLGTVYYCSTITTSTFKVSATAGGAAIDITDGGSGVPYLSFVWNTVGDSMHLDTTDLSTVFVDYANNDFRTASGSSPQVNSGVLIYGGEPHDMADAVRPNYEPATYPDNYWDIGPFEYDHGNGLAPALGELTITANASLLGSEIRIYDYDLVDDTYGTELSGTESNGSSTYFYTSLIGNTVVIQIMQSGFVESVLQYTYANATATINIVLEAETNA